MYIAIVPHGKKVFFTNEDTIWYRVQVCTISDTYIRLFSLTTKELNGVTQLMIVKTPLFRSVVRCTLLMNK
jgi:hypothetical protein